MNKKSKKENYLNLLKKGNYSLLVFIDRKMVFKSKKDGITPLLEANQKGLLRKAAIVDKTIGLAAAKIAIWSQVKEIYCLKISEKAKDYLKNKDIKINFEKTIKKVITVSGKECLMEKIASEANSLEEFIKARNSGNNQVTLKRASENKVFPDGYYTTTNQETYIHLNNKWIKVENIEMDLGIRVSRDYKKAACITYDEVKKGDQIVVSENGIKVIDQELNKNNEQFKFMSSKVSSERNKHKAVEYLASRMKETRKNKGKVVFVGGPAIIHTGSGKYLAKIIKKGYINYLFSGNALAVHDIEENLFGTSLGFDYKKLYSPAKKGYHHHLWAINTMRKYGSIKNAVQKGILKKGVMYQCIKNKVPFVLAGSIRDDGPLFEVISDTQKALNKMREIIRREVDLVIMCSTSLHSIAIGNLLPASCETVIVDINPAVVTKLADRGTTHALGLITDAEFFLKELLELLK